MSADNAFRLWKNGFHGAIGSLMGFFRKDRHPDTKEFKNDEAKKTRLLAILSNTEKAKALQENHSFPLAFDAWQKVSSGCIELLNTATEKESNKKIAYHHLIFSTYGMGYCAYRQGEIDVALKILEPAARKWWNDERINILYGVCLMDTKSGIYRKNPHEAICQAYPFLKIIETPTIEIEDSIASAALFHLATIYRTPDIPNANVDLAASCLCLQRASTLSKNIGNPATARLTKEETFP